MYVPKMELDGGMETPVEIEWLEEVEESVLRSSIDEKFYAFRKIEWVPFESATAIATEGRKPIHVIVLFGALDDESC